MSITIKKELHGKNLILFPCNSGALHGNYFLKGMWKSAAKYFPERLTDIDFAALDCIRTGIDNRAIVFENEMGIVSGNDEYPSFTTERFNSVCKGLELDKAKLSNYQKIIVYSNVTVYRLAALTVLGNMPSVTFFGWEDKRLAFAQANLPVLRKLADCIFYNSPPKAEVDKLVLSQSLLKDDKETVLQYATGSTRNGIRRPGKGLCRDVWDTCDWFVNKNKRSPTREEILSLTLPKGANATNTTYEFGAWRKFHGIYERNYTRNELNAIRFQNALIQHAWRN